jgi:hypothetical protein
MKSLFIKPDLDELIERINKLTSKRRDSGAK